jgi:hypothetical protein
MRADVADAEDRARRALPELAAEVRALAARIAKVFSGAPRHKVDGRRVQVPGLFHRSPITSSRTGMID